MSAYTDLASGRWAFEKGLHDLGNGAWAWLQPDGGWGWSNAGLIVDSGEALLVDTLFDLPKTQDMLDAMKSAEPAAADIDKLVNTHANGDHTHGNELVTGAEIISSAGSRREMEVMPPERLAGLMKMAREDDTELSRYLVDCFGDFEFEGITQTLPTRTFVGNIVLQIGTKTVSLIEVGPAHTRGDLLVYVPQDQLVYTGDILFVEGTPLIWQGPVANWISACDLLMSIDCETIVPGHGPITDKRGPAAVKAYLEYIYVEARKRYDAGLSAEEASFDIALDDFSSWGDAERIAVNVDTLYREFSGSEALTEVTELFARMAKIKAGRS